MIDGATLVQLCEARGHDDRGGHECRLCGVAFPCSWRLEHARWLWVCRRGCGETQEV